MMVHVVFLDCDFLFVGRFCFISQRDFVCGRFGVGLVVLAVVAASQSRWQSFSRQPASWQCKSMSKQCVYFHCRGVRFWLRGLA